MSETKTIEKIKTSRLPRINNELLRFKAFYFFFLSGFGSLMPYLAVYFRQMGLSASHVGLLIGIRPIVQFASAPFWAVMADRYKKRKPILVMSIFAWLIMTLVLAFVEPTNEICEMRIENNSMLQFVNYTKIKTGFFRRSFAEPTRTIGKTALTPATTSINTLLQNDSRNPFEMNVVNTNKTVRVSLSESIATKQQQRSKQTSASLRQIHSRLEVKSESLVNGTSRNQVMSRGNNSKKLKSIEIVNNKENNMSQNKPEKPSVKQTGTRASINATLSKRLPRQRSFNNEKSIYLKRGRKMVVHGGANLLKADAISTKHKRLDQLKTGNATKSSPTRQKSNQPQHSKIEFLRGDSTEDANKSVINIGERTTSRSGEEKQPSGNENLNNNSIPKHVKEAAEKLQKQLTTSINILNNIGKNSTAALLHHAIAMLSKKEEGETVTHTSTPKTISQLHNAIKDFVKSTHSSVNVEGSGSDEGSSLLLSSNNDLTNLAMSHINPKNGLNSPDNLHRTEPQETNKGVIHHNMLPHHALHALGHNIKVLTLAQMLGDQDASMSNSGSGSGDSSGKRPLSSHNPPIIISSEKNTGQDFDVTRNNTSQKEVVELNGQITKTFENLALPATLSGVISHANITLRNLLKGNEHEMSRIFTMLLVLIVVGEFLEAPSATLADASLLEVLGENRQFYGRQRLFGSIGFGVCSFIVGVMLEHSRHTVCGDEYIDYMICFCAFGIMMFMTLLVTSSFEFHYSDNQSSSGRVFSSLFNMHYGSCLIAACMMGVDFSMSHNFLAWLLEDLGASKSLMGMAVISRCFADTVTFYFAGSIIKKIGQVHIMIMVLISYTVILLMFSVIHNPLWVIPVEILDGVTYAMAWSALTSYLAGAVPVESVTTLQGM